MDLSSRLKLSMEMEEIVNVYITGPTALIRTSRTSNHPLNDNTSNNASIASPILSKLKRRGFALVME